MSEGRMLHDPRGSRADSQPFAERLWRDDPETALADEVARIRVANLNARLDESTRRHKAEQLAAWHTTAGRRVKRALKPATLRRADV